MKNIAVHCWILSLILVFQVFGLVAWPNQPIGSTLLSDNDFTRLPNGPGSPSQGWVSRYPGCLQASESFAPLSPPFALHYEWPHSQGYGSSCIAGYNLPAGTKDLYVGIKWKPSIDFWGWNVNHQKIMLIDATYNHMYVTMFRPTGSLPPRHEYIVGSFYGLSNGARNCHVAQGRDCDWFNANIASTKIALGQWHTLEVYMKGSTTQTSQDGVLMVWLDGQQTSRYTNINTGYPIIRTFELHPVWDALETSCPTCVDHHWFDHARLATGGTPGNGTAIEKQNHQAQVGTGRLRAEAGLGSVLFRLPENGKYSLKVFDLTGREVWKHAGTGEATWSHDGKLKRGIYTVRAEQNGMTMSVNFCQIW